MSNYQDSLLGIQFDEYRLEALLGRGGMARVYRALDVRLNRYAAIKVIDTPFRSDAEYVKRFEREAQAIARLEHPNVVRLYRYGEVPLAESSRDPDGAGTNLLYMAMQYVQGATLASVLDSYQRDGEWIPPEDGLRIIDEMGQALDYIHARGIIHRDIKPSNIMLSPEGDKAAVYHAVLTDFGLALLTQMGTLGETFGTPHYIAPEQAVSSAKAVPQSDLYSLGVILYEMMTGGLPFTGSDPLEVAMLHVSSPPTPPRDLRPELSEAVEAVILKALAKQPEDRYPSGAALTSALRRALAARQMPSESRISVPQRVTMNLVHPLPPLPMEKEQHTEPPAESATPPVDAPARLNPLERGMLAESPAAVPPTVRMQDATPMRGWESRPITADEGTGAPAASMPAASSTAASMPASTPRRSSARWLWIALGLVLLAVIAFACLLGGAWSVYSRMIAGQAVPTQATQVTAGLDATASPQVSTPQAEITRPASGAGVYSFTLARCGGEDCLVVKNTGTYPIPVAELQLQGKDSGLSGSQWGVALLTPGKCLRAVKDKAPQDTVPDGLTCGAFAGKTLVLSARDRFYKDAFSVTFRGTQVKTCDKNEVVCEVQVPK